ncbi:MAG: hypothetical protein HZC01_02855 [Candidatus Kerfeldbacteria bacterium]|nr:hypothetical protein [Candidatus Kerfeldbacteria bacterium]
MLKQKPLVLVVDDHPEARRILSQMVDSITGKPYRVLESEYGDHAVKAFEFALAKRPAVVIAQGHVWSCDKLIDRLGGSQLETRVLTVTIQYRGEQPSDKVWPALVNGELVEAFDKRQLAAALRETLAPPPKSTSRQEDLQLAPAMA